MKMRTTFQQFDKRYGDFNDRKECSIPPGGRYSDVASAWDWMVVAKVAVDFEC